MHELPPVPDEHPEKNMTLEQLEEKILALTAEINELLGRNAQATDRNAIKALQTMISKKLAERARYILRRGEVLMKDRGQS